MQEQTGLVAVRGAGPGAGLGPLWLFLEWILVGGFEFPSPTAMQTELGHTWWSALGNL